jgi:TRAP-type C4-dicarboxylate transport system permease small subunit
MRNDTARNVAIVVGLVVVFALPQAGTAGVVISMLLRALMIAAVLYFAWTMWRANRGTIQRLPDRDRSIVYAALALAAVLMVAWMVVPLSSGATLIVVGGVGGLGYLIWRTVQGGRGYY